MVLSYRNVVSSLKTWPAFSGSTSYALVRCKSLEFTVGKYHAIIGGRLGNGGRAVMHYTRGLGGRPPGVVRSHRRCLCLNHTSLNWRSCKGTPLFALALLFSFRLRSWSQLRILSFPDRALLGRASGLRQRATNTSSPSRHTVMPEWLANRDAVADFAVIELAGEDRYTFVNSAGGEVDRRRGREPRLRCCFSKQPDAATRAASLSRRASQFSVIRKHKFCARGATAGLLSSMPRKRLGDPYRH